MPYTSQVMNTWSAFLYNHPFHCSYWSELDPELDLPSSLARTKLLVQNSQGYLEHWSRVYLDYASSHSASWKDATTFSQFLHHHYICSFDEASHSGASEMCFFFWECCFPSVRVDGRPQLHFLYFLSPLLSTPLLWDRIKTRVPQVPATPTVFVFNVLFFPISPGSKIIPQAVTSYNWTTLPKSPFNLICPDLDLRLNGKEWH